MQHANQRETSRETLSYGDGRSTRTTEPGEKFSKIHVEQRFTNSEYNKRLERTFDEHIETGGEQGASGNREGRLWGESDIPNIRDPQNQNWLVDAYDYAHPEAYNPLTEDPPLQPRATTAGEQKFETLDVPQRTWAERHPRAAQNHANAVERLQAELARGEALKLAIAEAEAAKELRKERRSEWWNSLSKAEQRSWRRRWAKSASLAQVPAEYQVPLTAYERGVLDRKGDWGHPSSWHEPVLSQHVACQVVISYRLVHTRGPGGWASP